VSVVLRVFLKNTEIEGPGTTLYGWDTSSAWDSLTCWNVSVGQKRPLLFVKNNGWGGKQQSQDTVLEPVCFDQDFPLFTISFSLSLSLSLPFPFPFPLIQVAFSSLGMTSSMGICLV
jgi:hypothetical protein